MSDDLLREALGRHPEAARRFLPGARQREVFGVFLRPPRQVRPPELEPLTKEVLSYAKALSEIGVQPSLIQQAIERRLGLRLPAEAEARFEQQRALQERALGEAKERVMIQEQGRLLRDMARREEQIAQTAAQAELRDNDRLQREAANEFEEVTNLLRKSPIGDEEADKVQTAVKTLYDKVTAKEISLEDYRKQIGDVKVALGQATIIAEEKKAQTKEAQAKIQTEQRAFERFADRVLGTAERFTDRLTPEAINSALAELDVTRKQFSAGALSYSEAISKLSALRSGLIAFSAQNISQIRRQILSEIERISSTIDRLRRTKAALPAFVDDRGLERLIKDAEDRKNYLRNLLKEDPKEWTFDKVFGTKKDVTGRVPSVEPTVRQPVEKVVSIPKALPLERVNQFRSALQPKIKRSLDQMSEKERIEVEDSLNETFALVQGLEGWRGQSVLDNLELLFDDEEVWSAGALLDALNAIRVDEENRYEW